MEITLLLIGGAIGFFSSIAKDYFLEKNKNKIKQKEFKRQKIERVFILMDKVFQESIKPVEYRESLNGTGAELAMIIRFYFDDLHKDYKVFLTAFQEINEKFIPGRKQEVDSQNISDFFKAYTTFINKIVEESKKYE